MASCYAALASLLDLLDDILDRNPYPIFLLCRQQILNSLREKICFLLESQSLEVYSSIRGGDWERRIRDAAYQAQDIIQSQLPKQIHPDSGGIHLITKILQQLISAGQLRLEEPDEDLHKVLLEFDCIVDEVMAIKESPKSEALQRRDYSTGVDSFQPAPSGTSNTLVGLDEDIRIMKELLCAGPSQLQVISIVGMGGIGKTTLARRIYNDALIAYRFDIRVWITISQEYTLNEVLRSILMSLGVVTQEFLGGSEQVLSVLVYKNLFGRRYLIVIDDIWSIEAWDDVKRILPDNHIGSRVVLTSRLLEVCSYASGPDGHIHQMTVLSEDQSWSLLKMKVFGHEDCPPELWRIGRFIIRECRGLPLAIDVLSNTLAEFRTQEYWEMISQSMHSVLSSDDSSLFKILSQSYESLPPQLKACFLYIGSFPEDSDINISKLIKLWIAEGFLKPIDGSKTLEQVAEDCVLGLVNRSLLRVTKRRANGNIKYCTMHDIMRDLCIRTANQEKFFHTMYGHGDLYPEEIENVRRINVYRAPLFGSYPYVRSILWFGEPFRLGFDTIKWDSLEQLIVLGIKVTTWAILDAIFQMFHLKYLELSVEKFRSRLHLPPSISALQNLQTLIICNNNSVYSIALPPQIWKMTRLRHLIIGAMTLPPVPIDSGIPVHKLENLQTLMTAENFIFTKESIETIPNLTKLKISYKGGEGSDIWELYCLNNLAQLCRLDELKVTVYTPQFSCVDSLWSNIVFPLNLRKLSLLGCRFSWDEMTVVGSLPNLQVLRLREDSFVGKEWEPTKGEFKCLKFLLLEGLDLVYWQAEHSHFPCLEQLKISHCYELTIPHEIGDVSTLRIIDVYQSKHARNSALQIQEEQMSYGNDELEVRVRG